MRAIVDTNASKGLVLNWRLQSLANAAKQKIGPLHVFSGVFSESIMVMVDMCTWWSS